MNPRRKPASAALCLLVVVALGAACSPSAPTPSPSPSPTATPAATPRPSDAPGPSGSAAAGDNAATYAAIEEQVLAIRGLESKQDVDPTILDEEGVKEHTERNFREDNPPEYIAANELLLKAFGLLQPDESLEELYIELLGSQVAGFYSPDTKELYVVSKSGALGPTEKTTYAHEYNHALQDQNFDLQSFGFSEIGEGDRSFARLALVEGDATLLMSIWQVNHLTQAEIMQLLGESLDPEATEILQRMPPVLRDSLFFPYTQGLTFTQRIQSSGGWDAVNAAFENPPASTEQILHPDKYESGEAPIDVTVPADLAASMGDGWSVTLEDTLGEFQVDLWLENAGGAGVPDSAEAAAGWGGDRVAILEGANDDWAVVLKTQWDTATDLEQFREAAATVVGAGRDPGEVRVDGDAVWVIVASDASRLGDAVQAVGLVAGV